MKAKILLYITVLCLAACIYAFENKEVVLFYVAAGVGCVSVLFYFKAIEKL